MRTPALTDAHERLPNELSERVEPLRRDPTLEPAADQLSERRDLPIAPIAHPTSSYYGSFWAYRDASRYQEII